MKRGIHSIEDIRARCVVDQDSGCWTWSGAMSVSNNSTPMLYVMPGLLGNERGYSTSGVRVAWLLSGRRLGAGRVVWRHCCNHKCLAPDHLRSGTRADLGRHITAAGLIRVDPSYRIQRAKHSQLQPIPADIVRQIEADMDAGVSRKDLRARYSVGRSLLWKIATGQHTHQRGRLAQGASVFSWRPA